MVIWRLRYGNYIVVFSPLFCFFSCMRIGAILNKKYFVVHTLALLGQEFFDVKF